MSKIKQIEMPLSIEHLNRDMVKEMIGTVMILILYIAVLLNILGCLETIH